MLLDCLVNGLLPIKDCFELQEWFFPEITSHGMMKRQMSRVFASIGKMGISGYGENPEKDTLYLVLMSKFYIAVDLYME